MISMKELLHGHNIADVPIAHQHNLEELKTKINIIRSAYNMPMIVTSGYRSEQEHLNIYSRRGIYKPNVPIGSSHLTGKACDIQDLCGNLKEFLKANTELLESASLYCEEGTAGWIHFQTNPPRSGNRWFLP